MHHWWILGCKKDEKNIFLLFDVFSVPVSCVRVCVHSLLCVYVFSVIVERIDKDKNGEVTDEELVLWIRHVSRR